MPIECAMPVFSTDELGAMQATQEAAMMDTCDLLQRVETVQDDYGMPVVRWMVSGAGVACGLDTRSSREFLQAEAPVFDARLRVAIDTEIRTVDRVRITHRFGVELETAIEYTLEGEPIRGPSGLVLMLRSVVE